MSKYRPTYEELLGQYKKLAKKADRRLRQLEKLSAQEEFKSATRFAYKQAARDAMEWGASPDKPRFDIKPPKHKQQLQAKIHDIESFLSKDTSTKQGIVNVYQKSAQSLNEHYKEYGLDLTWDQLKPFFDSEAYKKIEKSYGSSVAVRAIARMIKNRMQVYKAIKNSVDKNVITKEKQPIISAAIDDAVSKYSDDVKKLLGEL